MMPTKIRTWLFCTKMSRPHLMKSAASKQGSNSVVTKWPLWASLCRSSTFRIGYTCSYEQTKAWASMHKRRCWLLTFVGCFLSHFSMMKRCQKS